MNTVAPLQKLAAKSQAPSISSHVGLLLQRKCACGSSSSLTSECTECKSKKVLQTKLSIGASNDPLELEADRVADQVMAAPANPAVCGTPPHVQRFTGQALGQADAAPASVNQVLSSSGRPLEPILRQDMEQRFGHDFSQVRVHLNEAAGRSARDVDANAYAVGHNIVFGANRFEPKTKEGRRLIAHELTHVVQQSDFSGFKTATTPKKTGLVVLRQIEDVSGKPPNQIEPRSLRGTLNIKEFSDGQIVTEIELIRLWLDRRLQSEQQQEEIVLRMLTNLGNELLKRHPEVLEDVQKQLAVLPVVAAGLPALNRKALAQVTKTGVESAVKRTASLRLIQGGAATVTGTGEVAGVVAAGTESTVSTAAGTAAGATALGLTLWGFLIFIFFAPRGEIIDPKAQKEILKALSYAKSMPKQRTEALLDSAVASMRDRRKLRIPEINIDPQADPENEPTKEPSSKKNRTCEQEYPSVQRCDGESNRRRAYFGERSSALKASIASLEPGRQKLPFTSSGVQSAVELPGADHETFWSADRRTKITIGCLKYCCIEVEGVPILRPMQQCYEHNVALYEQPQ